MQTTNKRAIVFDLGGVLIEWNPRHLYRKLFTDYDEMERFLAEVCTQEWNLQQDAGRPFAEAVAELSVKFPHYQELIQAYHLRWTEMVPGEISETVAILQQLKQANYPLYALSNWAAETFAQVRHRFPFLDWFDFVLISGDVKLVKPDARFFQLLLERANQQADNAIFIDDVLHNVTAAQQLGFTGIHFQSPAQLRRELINLGIL